MDVRAGASPAVATRSERLSVYLPLLQLQAEVVVTVTGPAVIGVPVLDHRHRLVIRREFADFVQISTLAGNPSSHRLQNVQVINMLTAIEPFPKKGLLITAC